MRSWYKASSRFAPVKLSAIMVEATLSFDDIFYTSEKGISKVKLEYNEVSWLYISLSLYITICTIPIPIPIDTIVLDW